MFKKLLHCRDKRIGADSKTEAAAANQTQLERITYIRSLDFDRDNNLNDWMIEGKVLILENGLKRVGNKLQN